MDTYTRQARLYPAFLVAAPLALLGIGLAPSPPSWWGKISAIVVGAGSAMLAAQFGRGAGKRKEPELYRQWGGKPTTQLLRHRGNPNPVALERHHRRLETMAGLSFPTALEERQDPVAADQTYDAAIEALRERTRVQKEFPLVFDELCNYGFRRNLWGHRPLGIGVSVAAAAGTAVALILHATTTLPIAVAPLIVVGLIQIAALAAWAILVTPGWVRQAAFLYAERLIASSERVTAP